MNQAAPTITYLLCATPRSGSTFLATDMAQTGVAGNPGEFLLPYERKRLEQEWGVSGLRAYVARLVRETMSTNGVFGFKVMPSQLSSVLTEYRSTTGGQPVADKNALNALFPNLHMIHVTRRDKVRQAVSVVKALQSNVWHVEKNGHTVGIPNAGSGRALQFSFWQIHQAVRDLRRQDRFWLHYFRENGMVPFTVVYEDLVADQRRIFAAVLRDFLGIADYGDHLLPRSKTKKMADALSEQWVARYHRIVQQYFLGGVLLKLLDRLAATKDRHRRSP